MAKGRRPTPGRTEAKKARTTWKRVIFGTHGFDAEQQIRLLTHARSFGIPAAMRASIAKDPHGKEVSALWEAGQHIESVKLDLIRHLHLAMESKNGEFFRRLAQVIEHSGIATDPLVREVGLAAEMLSRTGENPNQPTRISDIIRQEPSAVRKILREVFHFPPARAGGNRRGRTKRTK